MGQVLETVDGKPLSERVKAMEPYVTASHEVHRRFLLLFRALGQGAAGFAAVVA